MSPKKAGNRELTGKLKVKEFLLNGGQVPLWNIPENKLNQKHGLDIKPIYIPGGVRLTQSALSGSVDIAMTGAQRSMQC
jgi:ABC-type nitrate/sulfonate/bicarbonate transport system substrate-binding protein